LWSIAAGVETQKFPAESYILIFCWREPHAAGKPLPVSAPGLDRDDFSSNRHPALPFCLSMIFSENRFPLFLIML